MKKVVKTIYEWCNFAEDTEMGHDISVVVFYDSYNSEYSVESWNPGTYEQRPRRNVHYTESKYDALEIAESIVKRGCDIEPSGV